jgi:hypothetical protein
MNAILDLSRPSFNGPVLLVLDGVESMAYGDGELSIKYRGTIIDLTGDL